VTLYGIELDWRALGIGLAVVVPICAASYLLGPPRC